MVLLRMPRLTGGVREDCVILQCGVQAGRRGAGAVPLTQACLYKNIYFVSVCEGGAVSLLQGGSPSSGLHAGDDEEQGRL